MTPVTPGHHCRLSNCILPKLPLRIPASRVQPSEETSFARVGAEDHVAHVNLANLTRNAVRESEHASDLVASDVFYLQSKFDRDCSDLCGTTVEQQEKV